ncbi:MAG: hypothetical protein J3K34DRAFT_516339 [Monoraphidium minutum]|nr:MAG: hypothetical protein J3K34DRAFT_516339 [Monoraphidium minutum]
MMPVGGGPAPMTGPAPPVTGVPVAFRPILPPVSPATRLLGSAVTVAATAAAPREWAAAHGGGRGSRGRCPLREITRKIKKWQLINLALTLVQLGCSIAIISIVSNSLQVVRTVPTGRTAGKWSYSCYAATTEHPSTCQYAYSLASISIFAGFVVSLMQCLTLDCCGMGRIMESLFDGAATAWWIAGAATLTNRASEANMYDVPNAGSRNSVVGLAWACAAAFAALCVTNIALTSKLGKAYKSAVAQQQAAMAAGGAPYGVHMAPTAQMATPANYPPPGPAGAGQLPPSYAPGQLPPGYAAPQPPANYPVAAAPAPPPAK